MTRVTIEGQSDSPVTIPTTPPITVTPVNNTYSRLLTSEQRDQFTAGQVVTLSNDTSTQSVTIPDYTDNRAVTILPAAGTVLTGTTMQVSALPLSPDWRYTIQVNDATNNSTLFFSDPLSSENNYEITNLPTNGETLRIFVTVNKDDGQGNQVFTQDVTAFTDTVVYSIFDAAFASSTFEVRPFGVNIDDTSAAPVTTLIQGTRYRIRAAFRDTDGVYTGNLFPQNPVVPLTSNFGNPAFAKRQGTSVYNLYEFTPSGTGTVNFNFGVYTDSSQSTPVDVTVSFPVTANTGYVPAAISPLRVTPAVEGYGTQTAAGRGGQVIVVTSNASTGAGTFAEALATAGPRQIFFDISGEIVAPHSLTIAEGQVSVYGQTARGDGVYLRGATSSVSPTIKVHSSDILFQNFRFMRGGVNGNGGSADAITIGDPNNNSTEVSRIVFDHCLFTWGVDEVLDTFNGPTDITFYRCIISEGLYDNSHSNSTPGQGYLAVIGKGTNRISLIQNIWSCCDYRSPGVFGALNVDVFNNLIACYGRHAFVAQPQFGFNVTGNVEDNLFIDATTETTSLGEIFAFANPSGSQHPPANIRMLVSGNGRQTGGVGSAIQPVRVGGDGGPVANPANDVRWNQPRVSTPRPASIPLTQLESVLTGDCGAGPDTTTQRLLQEINSRNAPWKDLVGGESTVDLNGNSNAASVGTDKDVPWPVMGTSASKLGSAANGYVPDSWRAANNQTGNPITTDSNGDGYPDIEDWLYSIRTNGSSNSAGSQLANIGAPRLLPDAQGYGMSSTAPHAFNDLRVVNNFGEFLSNLGSNRVLFCNFSGWHTVSSQIEAGHPNLRICGQTAPGQGFGITCGTNSNNLLSVGSGNNTVLEHFRLAPTSSGPDGNVDPIRVENNSATNVLLRHMAFFAGRDQNMSIWFSGTQNIIIDKCIIGPNTYVNQSRGAVVGGGSTRVLFYRSLFAGCNNRNPMFQGLNMSVVNCIVSGWAAEPITWQDKGGGTSGNGINNLIVSGPDSNPSGRGEVLFFNDGGSNYNVYLAGNIGTRQPSATGDQKLLVATAIAGVGYDGNPSGITLASGIVGPSLELGGLFPADQLPANLYPIVGPVPNRRDSKTQDTVQRSQAGTMRPDQSFTVNDLPTLSGGPVRIDSSRADKTSAQWRSQFGIADSTNCLTTTAPDGNRLIEHFLDWLGKAA